MLNKIKELRQRTNLGMTDCKKALDESQGDLEQAILILQKRGLKKVDDLVLALEGQVQAKVRENKGVVVEVNCQTDFGAKSENFTRFLGLLTTNLLAFKDETLEVERVYLSNQLGESIKVRRWKYLEAKNGEQLVFYNHLGGKIAVVLRAKATLADVTFLENVAMHIAATNPLTVNRSALPSEWVNNNRLRFEEEVANKPEAIRKKIVDGKLEKCYAEVVLLEQESVWEPKKTIQQLLPENVEILEFMRYERGASIYSSV